MGLARHHYEARLQTYKEKEIIKQNYLRAFARKSTVLLFQHGFKAPYLVKRIDTDLRDYLVFISNNRVNYYVSNMYLSTYNFIDCLLL